MKRVTGIIVVAALALASVPGEASAGGDSATPATSGGVRAAGAGAETDAQMTPAELDRLLAPLYDAELAQRAGAAKALSELGDDATSALEKKLAELRKTTTDVHPVIKALRDTNTGKMGDGWDLGDALLRARTDAHAWRVATTTVLLVRALAHIGTTRAVKAMIPVALDQQRAFQGEVQAQLRVLGERAVAGLIESRKDPSGDVRRFGTAQLEAMNKRLPGEAVQTKSNQVLADVLRAYGLVRDMDAMGVILSFVNSERAQVRTAAREALAAFGQDAIWKLRETYANVVGKSAPEGWNADQIARELFAAYDRFRLQEVYALFEEGLTAYHDGKLEDATAAFDKVLARQPTIERRAEMVPAYVAHAQSIEAADRGNRDNRDNRDRALALFRKALRLDSEGARAPQIKGEIAYLEGMDMLGRGIADSDAFRRALAFDGGNAKARAELDRLEAAQEVREERTRRWAAGGAVLALAVALIVIFGGARSKAANARARA
jgi:hypothetical protein